ncbi:MAG: TraR/DksA family transcriptional regulator [Rhodoferax sp.]|nr:TraR/DksA family transcriptional regulator [Rhodoferax sp.]
MDQAHIDRFRNLLLGQRAALLAQLALLRGGAVGRAEASAAHFGQTEDSRAQSASERELEFALDDHEVIALSQIDAALRRLEAGAYGECMDCGKAIPMARLEVTPQALRCIGCQDKFEREGAASVT